MNKNERLIIQAAELRYKEGYSQNEIADIMNLSRSTISRLLDEAERTGIVQVTVNCPIDKNYELGAELKNKFGLKQAIVISGSYTFQSMMDYCGSAAVELLDSIIGNNMILGIVWGRAIRSCCSALTNYEHTLHGIHVAQMAGCLSDNNMNLGGLDLALRFAQHFGGTYSNIYAPIDVSLPETYKYLMKEKVIREAIEQAERADIVLTSIGYAGDDNTSMYRAGCYNTDEREMMISKGGTALMLGRWINAGGDVLECPGHYIMAADPATLKQKSWSIGISVSSYYAPAVAAAIRGKYINTLITDEGLAEALITLDAG